MITILSPAKTLDFQSDPNIQETSTPRLQEEQHTLIKKMQTFDSLGLQKLMGISPSLGDENYQRFQDFEHAPMRQALLTFNGHVYQNIDWRSYQKRDYEFAQAHLRMISGLYGLLRPLDLIKPYRLEMSTKVKTDGKSSLYEFWGDKILNLLLQDLQSQNDQVIVNLASNEYSKAVLLDSFEGTVVTPIFKDWNEKSGTYRVISVYAKLARGMMTHWIITNKINKIQDLERFAESHYTFVEKKEIKKKTTRWNEIELLFNRDDKPT